jgi:hypothetical protein
MGKARAFTALLTAAGITALTVTSAGAAGAASTGVGSAQGSSAVFSLALGPSTSGSALLADLIGDLGSASNDPAAGGSAALSRLAGLQAASSLVPALNLQVPPTPVQAQSPNGSPSVSTPAINLSNVHGVSVPAAVASGTIEPASLTATVDSTGAHAGLSAGVSSIALAGGLVALGSASTQVTNDAGGSQASSVRSLKAGPLTVLSLGQLLAGLGIPLTDLPVTTLAGLLSALHLPLPSIPGATGTLPSSVGLAGEVGALAQSIEIITTALQVPASALIARPSTEQSHLAVGPVSVSTSGSPVPALPPLPQPTGLPAGAVTSGISSPSGALTSSAASSLEAALAPALSALGLGGVNLASALSTLTSLTSLLDTLQGDLSNVLAQALSALDAAPLLKVSGLDIGLTTKATNAVSTSVASLTGTVGTVSVGNLLSTPLVNLTDTVSQLSSLVGSLDSAIGSVLGKVSPSLTNLVHVSVLTPVAGAGVSAAKGYVKAVEGVTALTATITPPADLSSLVSSITSALNLPTTAAGILGLAGVPTATVAALTSALSPIATLSATLSQTLGALANGATLKVGTIAAASDFAPAPVPGASPSVPGTAGVPTPSKLPFTGGNPVLAIVGGGALAALLIGRRLRLARRAQLG